MNTSSFWQKPGVIAKSTKTVFVILVFVVWSGAVAFAADPPVGGGVFEVTPSAPASWYSTSWGAGNPQLMHNDRVAITYRPDGDQDICVVKHAVYKWSVQDTTDNMILTVQEGAPGSAEPVLRTTTLGPSQITSLYSLDPANSHHYTTFPLTPCVHLNALQTYVFTFSRTNFVTLEGGQSTSDHYYSDFALGSNPNAHYFEHQVWDNGEQWYEYSNTQPSLRLEGPPSPEATEGTAHEPVIIIPGIAGTELKNGSDLIWPNLGRMFTDIGDQFLTENLGLDGNGSSLAQVATGDVVQDKSIIIPSLGIDRPIFDTFKSLRLKLESAGYTLDQDLFFFPYDWRMNLDNTASLLAQKIEAVKTQTGATKVNLIAHSMGGLLTKDYIAQYGKGSLDKLIFVGTPHLGAPKAAKIILAGDRLDIPWLDSRRIKEIGDHSVAVHELLPSQTYFDDHGSYMKFSIPQASGNLLSYDQTKQLLLDHGSTIPVFSAAEGFFSHDLEDTNFSGVDTYNIAGCDLATQAGYEVRPDGSIGLIQYSNGDKTVPLISADSIQLTSGHKFYVGKSKHTALPSLLGVRNLIADILSGSTLGNYENVLASGDSCSIQGKELIWRSPVEVHIYDKQGNHTGPIDNGGIEENVPGVDYQIFGHEKFIFLPSGQHYQVIGKGLDTGTFDLSIRNNIGGAVTGAEVFNDVAVTPSTNLRFDLSDGLAPSGISIDPNGTGIFASVSVSSMLSNATQANDITSPSILIQSPASTSYSHSTMLPITAQVTDTESGVASQQIFLDGEPVVFSPVDLFFRGLGSHRVLVVADDRAGNRATASFDFLVTASATTTLADFNRAYALGWIKPDFFKNTWIKKGWQLSANHIVSILQGSLTIDLVQRIFTEMQKEYTKGTINPQAYNLLSNDIVWLVNH